MTSHHTRIFYCNDMKNKSNCFHKKTKWINSVWMHDLYMLRLTKETEEEFFARICREYILLRSNEWFRKTRELDPHWKSRPVICTVNMELKSESGLWVKIILNPGSEFLMGSNKVVIDSIYNNTEILADPPEEQALQSSVKFFAARSKTKAKPQKRETVDLLSVIPMNERKWIDIEPEEPSLSAYEISKNVIHLLRHSQTVQRKDDGAIQFWRSKNYLHSQFPQTQ